jgi:hypothetical protein
MESEFPDECLEIDNSKDIKMITVFRIKKQPLIRYTSGVKINFQFNL